MSPAIASYIRKTGLVAAMANVVINPALAWLLNRNMAGMTPNSVVMDTAVTSVVLSLVVSLCVTSGVRRDLQAGRLTITDASPCAGFLLSRLPRQGRTLGLVLGVGVAVVLALLTFWLLHLFGLNELSFPAFALFKVTYTAPLAYVVARWVILRQLLPVA